MLSKINRQMFNSSNNSNCFNNNIKGSLSSLRCYNSKCCKVNKARLHNRFQPRAHNNNNNLKYISSLDSNRVRFNINSLDSSKLKFSTSNSINNRSRFNTNS
jgi:hypothetical protein